MGDNTAIFTPSDSNDRSYESAVRLSKYLSTFKICKDYHSANCRELYYPITPAVKEYKDGAVSPNLYPKMFLNDGSILAIAQYEKCEDSVQTCQKDQYGNCLKDENGNSIGGVVWNKTVCAYIYLDVNGAQGPNKFGKDNFLISVDRDKFFINTAAWAGGKNGKNIMLNKL